MPLGPGGDSFPGWSNLEGRSNRRLLPPIKRAGNVNQVLNSDSPQKHFVKSNFRSIGFGLIYIYVPLILHQTISDDFGQAVASASANITEVKF